MERHKTHLTPLIAPPFRAHRRLPSALNASETGNSPSDETGSPRGLMLVGLLGSMEKREMVFDPGYVWTSAHTQS